MLNNRKTSKIINVVDYSLDNNVMKKNENEKKCKLKIIRGAHVFEQLELFDTQKTLVKTISLVKGK